MKLKNPFQQLITTCEGSPTCLQECYENHRSARNAQYKAQIFSPDFSGWQIDETLKRLHECTDEAEAQSIDTRNNLAFWARPPHHIRELIIEIQEDIRAVAPSLWFTPEDCLHTTVLEITHSRTPTEVDVLAAQLQVNGTDVDIANYTFSHPTRLVNPKISYDTTAIALSFLPAIEVPSEDDWYTYHHLRRDLFDRVVATGTQINNRYVAPSAHITIARFITQDGLQGESSTGERQTGSERVRELIKKIESINAKLSEHWPEAWIVGEEKGLDFRKGQSWYGGGKTIAAGRGF